MVAQGLIFAIQAYRFFSRFWVSVFGGACRFHPTCSCYGEEAIRKHGAFKGGLQALGRILRCSPLSAGGYDPV